MPGIEIGRVVVKTHGREAGQKAVVVDIVDENFVLVSGPQEATGVRRRRANIRHLEPTSEKLQIKSGIDDKDLLKLMGGAKPKEERKKAKEKPAEPKKRPKAKSKA